MVKNQKQFVISHLREHKKISRNFALRCFISRLSAIILTLKKEGWVIIGENKDNDCIYSLKAEPTTSDIVKGLREWRDNQVEDKVQAKLI